MSAESELYDDAPCGYVTTLPDGTIVRANRALLHWIGCERDDKILEIAPDPARGRVFANPSQIERVINNLIVNARDAMGGGGRLTITVEDATLGDHDIKAHPSDEIVAGSYVMLSVADTGSGMDAATLTHVFEPFFTTKPVGEGVGLGLSMVYGIVKQHGGQIWATSAPGRGTVIRIYLPAVKAD